MISLLNLPEVEFASKDVSQIEADIITAYEAIAERKLAPGDPVRLFLQTIAALIAQQRMLIDFTAKQNLLRYAVGNYLDQIGARYGYRGARLSADNAVTTVRYTLSTAHDSAIIIPAGNRSSPGQNIFFATKSVAEIPAGQLYADVIAECTEGGKIGNGYTAGQINIMVDPISYIAQVSNIDTSQGGSDVETDENYRERLFLLPESFSVAGPSGAYKYFAQQFSPAVADVSVLSPSAGIVDVRFILQNGELPDAAVIEEMLAHLSDKRRRPLTDYVTVQAPTEVEYNITLTYYLRRADASFALSIQAAVDAAVADYVIWQKSKIGRSINPSELISRIVQAGAKRVDLTSPEYAALGETELAVADVAMVTYGGLEDD